MKRILTLVLVLLMILALLTGCVQKQVEETAGAETTDQQAENQPAEQAEQNTDESEGQDINETGMLNLMWSAAKGTDSMFESPWSDLQCLYPSMVFDPLISSDGKGGFVPKLASDWSVSTDGLEYTFTLAEGVKWHDGEPFTVEDVLFSLYGVLADPNSNMKWGYLAIEGAQEVIDGATDLTGVSVEGNSIKIRLLAADNSFLINMAYLYILPDHLLKDVPLAELQTYEDYWKKPIGTGAYMIDQVSFPDFFTCVRNETYFGEKAGIKNVLFTSYATGGSDAAVASLISGSIDIAYGSTVNDISIANNIVAQNRDIKCMLIPSNQVRQFGFNMAGSEDGQHHPDIVKESVRQAFNLILDKAAIAGFYGQQAVPMTTYVPSSSPLYNTDIVPFERNVELAVQMLEEADFDFSHPIRICYYYSDQTTVDIMEFIKQNFAEAGITCEPSLASGDLGPILYDIRNYDMLYLGGGPSDPIQSYQKFTDGSSYDRFLGDLENREAIFNDLFTSYLASTDIASMKEYGDKLQAAGLKYAGLIPVYGLNKILLYNQSRVQIPEDILASDNEIFRDWRFAEWSLIG